MGSSSTAASGYESAPLGLWAWVSSLQAAVGLVCLGLSNELVVLEAFPTVHAARTIHWVDSRTFKSLGAASLASAMIVLVAAVISFFVIPRLSGLAMCLSGTVAEIIALANAIIIGLILGRAAGENDSLWDSLRREKQATNVDYTGLFATKQKPAVIFIGVGSFLSAIVAARAQSMSSTARALDALLLAPCLAVGAAIASYVVLQHAFLRSVLFLGIMWMVGVFFLLLILQQQKVLWPRFTSIALALLSLLLALFALIGVSACSKKFSEGKVYTLISEFGDYFKVTLPALTEDQFKQFKTTAAASFGDDFLVLSALSAAAALGFVAVTLASFRAVLGPSPAEKEMAQETAEEAVENREEL